MNVKRAKWIMRKLQPYVNGKLITSSFEKYWDELKEIINAPSEDSV